MIATVEQPVGSSYSDFLQMCVDLGFTASEIRHLSEDTRNQIPFPSNMGDGLEVADSPIEGKGLFAKKEFPKGTVIAPAAIAAMRTPAGRYTNHCDQPNAYFACTPKGDVLMYANATIFPNTEITVNYRQSKEAAVMAHLILNGVY
jgi:hypothetical protein